MQISCRVLVVDSARRAGSGKAKRQAAAPGLPQRRKKAAAPLAQAM